MRIKKRNPDKFESLDLYAAVGAHKNLRLDDPASLEAFSKKITGAIQAFRPDSPLIYGKRTEIMFSYVAASLGSCSFIKQEDSGDFFSSTENIEIPDFRIKLKNGKSLLVEVKNFHKKDPKAKITFSSKYFEGLKNYAELNGIEIKIAIYWSAWNFWALLPLEAFDFVGGVFSTSFMHASTKNEMGLLGDFTIGTVPPLIFRVKADPLKPRNVDDNGLVQFTIGGIDFLSENKLVTSEEEQKIAWYLMLNGDWGILDTHVEIRNGEFLWADNLIGPEEYDEHQGFALFRPLSSMISSAFRYATSSGAEVTALRPQAEASSLGLIIREDYKGHVLRLWRFHLEPSRQG